MIPDISSPRDYAARAAKHAANFSREADALARSIIRITQDTRTMDSACSLSLRVTEAATIALDMAIEAQTSSRADWLCGLAQDAASLAGDFYSELQTLGIRAVAARTERLTGS